MLVNCAADCIEKAGADLAKINYCLRHLCAFHCFDGSCLKCSAFVTRIFNQVCVAADLRSKVLNWSGHCYEMFRGWLTRSHKLKVKCCMFRYRSQQIR